MRNRIPLLCIALLSMAVLACGDSRKTVFVGEAEPEDFSLSFQMPQEFEFGIPAEGAKKFDLAIELTYFPEQMQGWESIPLYYILVRPEGEEDKRLAVSVRDDKGEWRGDLLENDHDRRFEETIVSGIGLAPGKHTFKLYGDSKVEGKPILGIVRVTFKVYEAK